jgi:hypothetical protein
MDKILWDTILAFDFDNPPSEYGFSTRLANENYWTKDFTDQAILEYKKFMYLAATSDFMVSPSEVIDTVWHQHLIFTQSYQDFCRIIGKQVQHIPSTHNQEEFEKFRQAKERTKVFYSNIFGEQPGNIWGYNDMYESLCLEKAGMKLRTFLIIGILAFILLTIPFYFFLRPIYTQIDNPLFIFGLVGLEGVVLLSLENYNRATLKKIIRQSDSNSFIFHLHPLELTYLKTKKLETVINASINELIDNGTIQVNNDNTIELSGNGSTNTTEQLQTANSLHALGKTYYILLLRQLTTKPIFWNTANCMDAFKKYFNKSKKFGRLFYLNFGILSILLMFGLTRVITGVLRDKAVTQIVFVVIALMAATVIYLLRLTKLTCVEIIPNLYKNEILSEKQIKANWQWSYFLLGNAALATTFVPLVNYNDRNDSGGSSSGCGTSCGSSCGSSCSSCGGCGGGD